MNKLLLVIQCEFVHNCTWLKSADIELSFRCSYCLSTSFTSFTFKQQAPEDAPYSENIKIKAH